MNWDGLNQINTILGIINGIVGIANICSAIWGWLSHKNQKQFMKKLSEERENAQKENARMCRVCKSNFKSRIKSLEKTNNKLLDKVKS